ncbi:MAG: protein-L-isoaspartate O-methyltransferase family protein [Bosea sp. (in: a-proteobacteria)]
MATGTAGTSGNESVAALRAASLRRAMVDCQIRTYDVTDRAVLAAMDEVAREAFMPGYDPELAYLDRAETIHAPEGGSRTMLTPMVLARMLQFLDVQAGEKVLDYAGGAGYSAAVMSAMGAKVDAVDSASGLSSLARAALDAAHHGDVTTSPMLNAAHAGFDAILINGACETQPDAILARLATNGRAIAVIGQGRAAKVMLYQRSGDVIAGRMVFDAAAPMLDEFRKPAEFVF